MSLYVEKQAQIKEKKKLAINTTLEKTKSNLEMNHLDQIVNIYILVLPLSKVLRDSLHHMYKKKNLKRFIFLYILDSNFANTFNEIIFILNKFSNILT